jgi:hypothetical protein
MTEYNDSMTNSSGEGGLERYCFYLGKRPQCIWGADIRETNIGFLNGIDASYFSYIANENLSKLSLDNKVRQYAAVSLRVAYTHSLETLFALICSSIQAPAGVAAWMVGYKNPELDELVRGICEQSEIKSIFETTRVSWGAVSRYMLEHSGWIEDEQTTNGFAKFLGRLAADFLEDNQRKEYNSYKHGLRLSFGGFSLALGIEDVPGVPAPVDSMQLLGSDEFGSTFYYQDQLEKHNFQILKKSLNWNPVKYANALVLISMAIENVIASLRISNGINPTEVQFYRPSPLDGFDEPWRHRTSLNSFDFNRRIDKSTIETLTKEEIIEELDS